MMRKMLFCSIALASVAVCADGVKFQETTTVLPTYAPGGYDKTPLFYTGRVYQGAQGRVYPYPMQDVLHDGKVDETYTYLTLENEWLQMGLLPEHGGHLLNFTDKQTGFETFYRQHVVKPALIGMLGAWISGGVEWNFPHHHRATTAMPIDWRMTERGPEEPSDMPFAAGSKTIWIGETELRRRLKWTIGLSMMPDRAVLQAENVFMNRQPWIESMIYWANVSVHCGDDYQILFPPSCHLGFDHHKNYWTSFPIGPRKEEVELLPSQRSKYADDISGTMDLSWWKNFTIESRSIFAMDPDNAWLAGYDHKRQMGTAHVSNRHITVGKKFFLWGNFPEAHVWDTVLTDHDGPYLELMVGCWSDNQPDYSWIAPYETRKVKQFWFPVKGIGGVKNVTIDGAVNVDRRGKDALLVGFYSTRVLKNCTVTVTRGGKAVFKEKGIALDPNTPWCKPVKVAAEAADQEFTASIADADGKVFLFYTPVGPDPHDPLPPKVENPKPPKEYASAELAYEVGLRLTQFHNGLIDPEPYYRRALELDPDYSKANLAMGVRLAKNGDYARARPYLERAVKRVTQNHTRALDAAPEYYLALCHRGLAETAETGRAENLKKAEDLFWRCTWRSTHKKESFFEIVRLCCLTGRYREAHDILEFSLMPLAMDEAKVHTLHAYIHRKLKDCPEAFPKQRTDWKTFAANNQKRAFACDPLEYWGQCEETFREGGDGAAALAKAEKNRGLKAQQLMETVCDYWGIGAWDEVIALCDAALAKAAVEKPYATEGALPLKDTLAACNSYKNAMFGYFKAFALAKRDEGRGMRDEVGKALDAAGSMPTDYCFPSRLEELAVLMWAADGQTFTDKGALANTHYYLGEILWNMDQKEAAKASWQVAVKLNPKHTLALRCLGFAESHPGTYFTNTGVPSGVATKAAYDYYLKSLEADPGNFRTLDEAGKLAEKLNLPAAERLALMEKYRKTVDKYDPCILRLAYTYNATGRFKEAHEILTTRRFHVWEGADGLLAPFVESCLGLGREAMAKKDFKTALGFFEESTTYPANLQAGRPGDAGTEPKSRYFMAQCKKVLGDAAGYKAELENSLKGWIHAGEMDYWRVKALRELGRDAECAPLIAELRQAIKELETPAPVVINAYAKFAGDNSAMERAAKAREKAGELRRLLEELTAGESVPTVGEPTGCPEFTVETPRATTGAVIRAVDFGFDARSDKNATAINRALAEAKRVKASRVELAPGTYRCFDEPGVVIRDFADFTFDGKGAVLVFRRPAEYRCQPQSELILDKGNVLVQRCVRTEVCNLTMDWDWKNDPLAGYVKCVAKHPSTVREDAWFELEFVDWERHPFYPNPCPLQKLQAMRDDHKGFRKGFACSFGQSEGHFGAKNEWMKPNVLRVWPGVPMPGKNQNPQHVWGYSGIAEKVTVGETYRIQHCYYGKNGFNFDSNRHFTLRDVTVWSCFGMAFVTDGTQKYWQFENVKVVPPTKAEFEAAYPGERFFERPVTSVSDGHHVARSCGWCKYLNCTWSRNNDDSSNFHDRFTIAIRVADKALQIVNRRGEEYFRASVGTTFELRNPDFSPTGAFVKLVRKSGNILYVDRVLPEQKGQCFLVWDRTYGTDNVLVKGCRFVDSAFRNIFSPSNLTIEDCEFVRTGGYPIQFIADYRSDVWCEGMGATNLVVRNCRFEDTNVIHPDWAQISTACVTPTGWQIPAPDKGFVGGDLLIEGCTFVRPTGPVLKLPTGKNVIFRNSTIDLRDTVGATESAGKLLTDGAENVKVENIRYRH